MVTKIGEKERGKEREKGKREVMYREREKKTREEERRKKKRKEREKRKKRKRRRGGGKVCRSSRFAIISLLCRSPPSVVGLHVILRIALCHVS